jgi:hypothetical protein
MNNTGSSQHLYPLLLHSVPEPGTLAVLAGGVLALACRVHLRRGQRDANEEKYEYFSSSYGHSR